LPFQLFFKFFPFHLLRDILGHLKLIRRSNEDIHRLCRRLPVIYLGVKGKYFKGFTLFLSTLDFREHPPKDSDIGLVFYER
jgi:hypothetical protein